jgi:hypothetical protein
MGSYREYQVLTAPPWLQGPNGGAWQAELGGAKDEVLDRARLGVLARMPGKIAREQTAANVEAPPDALDHIGADRGTPRAPAEADPTYATRLLAVWATNQYLGGPYGVLKALDDYGYTGVNLIYDNGRYWYLSGGVLTTGTLMAMITRGRAGWMFDADPLLGAMWSRFGLLFTADAANLSGAAGQAILNSIVERWRSAASTYMGAWVLLAGGLWGWPTTETWGAMGATWGGASVRFIPPGGGPAIVTGP